MTQQKSQPEEKVYDEEQCLKHIRQTNSENERIANLSDDDLTYLIDLIYEYMDDKGFIPSEDEEIDADEEFEVDVDDIYDYVKKNISRDEMNISLSNEDFLDIYDAETEYSESLLEE